MREPIRRENWEPILNSLKTHLETLPSCREREMIKFYIEELYYRMWHHCTGIGSMATDLDFIEYRWIGGTKKRVGFIEVKSEETARIRPRTTYQEDILVELSKDAKTPLWRTTFSPDLTWFKVEGLNPPCLTMELTEAQYKPFIVNLGKLKNGEV